MEKAELGVQERQGTKVNKESHMYWGKEAKNQNQKKKSTFLRTKSRKSNQKSCRLKEQLLGNSRGSSQKTSFLSTASRNYIGACLLLKGIGYLTPLTIPPL